MTEIRTAELADEVGVSRQRISQWEAEGLRQAAKVRRGWFDRERALAWIGDRREDQPTGDTEPSGDLIDARIRLYTLQGDGVALRNALLSGELVTRERVTAIWAELMTSMVTLVDEWVRDGGNAAQVARNQELANALRRRISDSIEAHRLAIDAGEDLGPTRVRLPRRVGG